MTSRSADPGAFRQGIIGRHGQQEAVAEQHDGFKLGLLERECQKEHVQRPLSKFTQQRLGLGFEQIETQIRMATVQFRQQQGENVRCQRRNYSEPQRPAEQVATVAYTICEITCGAEDRADASSDFGTGLGEYGSALTPRHQLRSELMFEFADLHGERGLTHRTFFRRPTKISMSGQCVKIP